MRTFSSMQCLPLHDWPNQPCKQNLHNWGLVDSRYINSIKVLDTYSSYWLAYCKSHRCSKSNITRTVYEYMWAQHNLTYKMFVHLTKDGSTKHVKQNCLDRQLNSFGEPHYNNTIYLHLPSYIFKISDIRKLRADMDTKIARGENLTQCLLVSHQRLCHTQRARIY